MTPLLGLMTVLAADPPAEYPSLVTDAGFALDAGPHGEVIDATSSDAGAREVEVSARVALHIGGAKVLPPEVYLDIIKLPDSARPNVATAIEVQRQLREFLLRTGYELAAVSAIVTPTGIDVEVDEGQIERVLFFGQLSFPLLQFKFALSLPSDVFNRPLLDQQVRELSKATRVEGVRWELVRTAPVPHVGPQITELPGPMDLAVQGDSLIHERRPYEVHVIFPDVARTGLGVDLRSGYLNGVESGFNFVQPDLIFTGARGWVSTSGGVGLRARLDTGKLYPHFSRAAFEVHYDLFPLLKRLRPGIWGLAELVSRQRGDLFLENYYAMEIAAALQLELEIAKGFHFTVGGGFAWRRLFGFEGTAAAPIAPDVVLADRKRPFLRVTHESVVDPTVLRWERRHTLESELRFFFPVLDQPAFTWVDVRYQYVHGFGWHDLWVNSRAHVAWGDVTFHDEVTVGEFVRAVFGEQWAPAAVNLQVEFRFSITRDVLKVGLFNDFAVIAVRPLRTEPRLVAEIVDGFGPAVHFLAQDIFQLDVYLTFGFRRGAFAVAPMLQLQKAF